MKKISVVIPIYYGKQFVPNLIEMLEKNAISLGDSEIIDVVFVNDSVQDGSILKMAKSEIIGIKVVEHEKNFGIHKSRVDGVMASDAEYVCFLDQDDQISPMYFESQLTKLADADVVICNGKNKSETIYESKEDFEKKITKEVLLKGYNYIVSPGQALIRKTSIPSVWLESVLENNGADDFLLWITMVLNDCNFKYNDKTLYAHVFTEENTSIDSEQMDSSVIEMANIISERGLIDEKTKQILISSRKATPDNKMLMEYKKRVKEAELFKIWKRNEIKNLSIENYLREKNVSSVSIYGLGNLGKVLVEELLSSEITVNAVVDKRDLLPYKGVPIVSLKEKSVYVDDSELIIVTVLFGGDEVRRALKELYNVEIVMLESILDNMDLQLDES